MFVAGQSSDEAGCARAILSDRLRTHTGRRAGARCDGFTVCARANRHLPRRRRLHRRARLRRLDPIRMLPRAEGVQPIWRERHCGLRPRSPSTNQRRCPRSCSGRGALLPPNPCLRWQRWQARKHAHEPAPDGQAIPGLELFRSRSRSRLGAACTLETSSFELRVTLLIAPPMTS